jgi:hypothetical protein
VRNRVARDAAREVQCHVDAGRHSCCRDNLAVLDDALAARLRAELAQLLESWPMRLDAMVCL